MRKVSEIAAQYFTGERRIKRAHPCSRVISDNTQVYNDNATRVLTLYNSEIMTWHEICHTLYVSLCGYDTNTTRTRLNDVLRYLYIKHYIASAVQFVRDKKKTWVTQQGFKLFALLPESDTIRIDNVVLDSTEATPHNYLHYTSLTLSVRHNLSDVPRMYEPATFKKYTISIKKEKSIAPTTLIAGVM